MKGLKKGERLSGLTFGQARVRGFTFKNWQRAVKISNSLRARNEERFQSILNYSDEKILRYSVSYMRVRNEGEYKAKTVRAYILDPVERKDIIDRLDKALKEQIRKSKSWAEWYVREQGFEKEFIDAVEAGNDERNKILFEGI